MVRYFYVDESWDSEKFCLAGFTIRDSDWHSSLLSIQEHRRALFDEKGIFLRKEIHAVDLVGGRGNIASKFVNKHTRARIFVGLLELVARLPGVKVFSVCLPNFGRRDVEFLCWNRLLNRIERTMQEFQNREDLLRGKLITDHLKPELGELPSQLAMRIRDFQARAMVFADRGKEGQITKLFRKMRVHNPTPSKLGGWPDGSHKNIPLTRVIEDPVFRDSKESLFLQLADCVAFALLKRETTPTPNILKHDIQTAFESALSPVCYKPASPSDPLGIVRA